MCDYIYDNYGKIFHSISQTGSFSHNLNEFALLFRVILLPFDIDICIICRILTFDLKFTVGDTIQPSACIVVIHSMIPFPVIFRFSIILILFVKLLLITCGFCSQSPLSKRVFPHKEYINSSIFVLPTLCKSTNQYMKYTINKLVIFNETIGLNVGRCMQ